MDAVLRGNPDVGRVVTGGVDVRRDLRAAPSDGRQREIRAVQRVVPAGSRPNRQVGSGLHCHPAPHRGHPLRLLRVDVEQNDLGACQLRAENQVGDSPKKVKASASQTDDFLRNRHGIRSLGGAPSDGPPPTALPLCSPSNTRFLLLRCNSARRRTSAPRRRHTGARDPPAVGASAARAP